ncbi:MAG: murein biosynthesis integral membrane protein MurJ [Fimbriimonadales bacterium]
MPETPEPKAPNVARASGIMFASLFLSRVLGILRDTVMAAKFGVGAETDAYRLAFQIPDLIFFAVAGGALSSAFIPVFSEFLHTDREEDAWKLFSVVVTLMSIIVIAFIALAWIFALPLAHVIAPGKSEQLLPLIAHMSRIVLPAQYAFFIGGLMFGTLYARQRFAAPGLAPNIYNLGIIFGAVFLSGYFTVGVIGMSWGAMLGAVVGNFVVPFYVMRKLGAKFSPSLDLKHPGVKKVFKLMLPVVLGLSLPGVYGLIMQAFGSYYKDGINTALDLSNKLMQAPLGIFGQSLALAVFPALTQFFAQTRMDMFRNQLGSTLRTVLYLTIPISVAMFILAPEIVALAYQYGKARNADLPALVSCLRMFSFGIFAWCMHPVLMRGFFAVQQSVLPVILGTVTTAIFLGLVYGLRGTSLSYLALPLSSSISAIALVIMLSLGVRSTIGGLDMRGLGVTLLKSALASVAMGLFVWAAVAYTPAGGTGIGRNAVAAAKLFGFGAVGAWLYYFLTKKMGMPETAYIARAMNRGKAAA